MPDRSMNRTLLAKLVFAAAAIVALVALPVSQLVPGLSVGELLLYSAGGLLAVLALLIVAAVVSLQFSQFILRKGGTDPQWFWFSSEPRGLVALRDRARDSSDR